MKLRWTPEASDELEAIFEYLERERPEWAHRTMQTLYDGVRSLRSMPLIGRLGERPGTRELVYAPLPYIAIYRVGGEHIEILGFRHTSRDRLPN